MIFIHQRREHNDIYLGVIHGFHETKVIRGANLIFEFDTDSTLAFTGFHALITSIEGKNTSVRQT